MMPVLPAVSPPVLIPQALLAAKMVAGKKAIGTDQNFDLPTGAMAAAKAKAEEMKLDFVTGEGTIIGDPTLQAGNDVSVKNGGLRWTGSYRVTSATHEFDPDTGYHTHFEIGGSEPNTFANLVDAGTDFGKSGRINGVMPGIVTNLMDPLALGRVKVKFAWLDDMVESDWARIATPMSGSSMGFQFTPQANDEVLVAFENGDFNRPYVVGGLWNMTSRPPLPTPKAVVGGKVAERIIKTQAGHIISLVDMPGKEAILIADKTGQNSIAIDSVKNEFNITCFGKTNVTSKQDVTVKSEAAKVVIDATQDISLTSKGGNVKIDCINFEVKAKAEIKLESNAQAAIKSQMVQLNGQAMVKVDGGVINATSNGPMMLMGKPVNINPPSLIVLP
jgi:uncharacterized protein involved in type VI secretion and phage assembly